jgi:hypothetical protein
MTNQNQSPFQNLGKDDLNRVRDDDQNVSSSSSSSSSRPQMTPYQALTRFRKEVGLENPGEFFCPATAKEKDRAAKLEALVVENRNEMDKANKTYTQLTVERAQEIDPSMDFLPTSKKIAMQKFYSKDPTAMPVKEVKPLRYNKLDRFAAKIESDVDIIGNAAIDSIKVLESGQQHQAMFHLTNIVDLARDARSEANLKRLEIRDTASAVLIKRHIDGATIVSPTMQEVIKEEKNQGFKRQNYYYKNRNYRRNSFSGFSHGFDSSTYQLAQTIQKLNYNNQFFPIPGNSRGRGSKCGFRGNKKY